MKKPESAPHSAATTVAITTAAQMFIPASLQSTPMMMLVRPMIEGAWMSMPPVIITSVTKSEMMHTLM